MKKKAHLLIFIFTICMISTSLLTGCGNKGTSNDLTSFTWWNGSGVDSVYYSDYADNPVVKYVTTQKTWGSNNSEISFEFQIPPAGSQLDQIMTMISTGDYTDIIDMSFYSRSGSVVELYNDGIVMDLTPYVEEYMPNYLAFLEAHPEYALTATNVAEGEKKYLQLYNYNDMVDQWGGFMYRRDWIVKYGTNPVTNESFTGGFGEAGNDETWTDDVVFPSGGSDPIYISDWEWMFEIFDKAMAGEGISDGYCLSLYYPGYIETGDLTSAFGGGAPMWYLDGDNVEFGATSDDFRTYLQCMNAWYNNGWLDTAFSEHNADAFYRIDSVKIHQGKVGLFYEAIGLAGNLLDISDGNPNSPENGYTNGIMVMGARPPINDIYGGEEQQGNTPFCMYQVSLEYNSFVVTDKAADKDLEALFRLFDYMYSEEGSLLRTYGLNKEQYNLTQDEFYTRIGLTDGAYQVVETDEGLQYDVVPELKVDTNLQSATNGGRLIGLQVNSKSYKPYNDIIQHIKDEWVIYPNTGIFSQSFNSQLTADETSVYAKTRNNINEFLTKNVPNFINGNLDIYDDDEWNAFVNAINKYAPDEVTQIFQDIYDSLS